MDWERGLLESTIYGLGKMRLHILNTMDWKRGLHKYTTYGLVGDEITHLTLWTGRDDTEYTLRTGKDEIYFNTMDWGRWNYTQYRDV